MKIVKESHLEILYEQVDQEIREKQERVKAAKKLKKRVTEIKTTITLMMEGPKKSNIFPAFSDF
jgi:cell division protein FtsB